MISQNIVKKFTGDVLLNTIAFGIYIGGQQIILLPFLAKYTSDEIFSHIVIFISIFSVITNTLGSELGITRQVRMEADKNEGIMGESYTRIMTSIIPLIIIPSVIILFIYKFNWIEIVLFSLIILLGNIRLYILGYFRLHKDFKRVVVQNVIFLIGTCVGLVIFYFTKIIFLPFVVAEGMSLAYGITNSDFSFSNAINIVNIKRDFSAIGKTFASLSAISFLTNLMVYFDKLIIYPILGSKAVDIYYAAQSMSKAITLIMNPLYGVILPWLGATSSRKKKPIVKVSLISSLPTAIVSAVASWPISYIALKLLYPQYLEDALPLLWPICFAVGFGVSCSLIKGVLLRYYDTGRLFFCYLSFFAVFIIAAFPLSSFLGLPGFVYATLIARFEQFVVFDCLLFGILRKTENNE